MNTLRLVILLACFAASAHAQDLKARLAVANSMDDVRKFCSRFHEFGEQHEASYTADDTKLFVVWVQPKESTKPAFLFAYVFRAGKWHLLVDHPETIQFADDAVAVSVTDGTIRLLSPDGRVAKTYDIR